MVLILLCSSTVFNTADSYLTSDETNQYIRDKVFLNVYIHQLMKM